MKRPTVFKRTEDVTAEDLPKLLGWAVVQMSHPVLFFGIFGGRIYVNRETLKQKWNDA